MARNEDVFQRQVIKAANDYGWQRSYHTHNSFRSDRGWPDLVLARMEPAPRVIFVELKTDDVRSKVSDAQQWWLDCLSACGQEAYCWRPTNWDEIHAVLSRGTPFTPLLGGTND